MENKPKNSKSDFLAYLEKKDKVSPSCAIYFTTKLLIICDFIPFRAIILAQLLWLSDQYTRKDGFFRKTHKELAEETGASRRTVVYAIDWFVEQGFLKTKTEVVMGRRMSHFRFDKGMLFSFSKNKIVDYNS